MQLTFSNPGFPYMLESIMQFQTDAQSAFWSEPLYHFYPRLDRAHAERLPLPRRKEYIAGQMEAVYRELEGTLDEKAAAYAGWWERCRGQVTEALSEAFELDCGGILNDMRAFVTLNPICPRYLKERRFDLFYLNSEKGAVGLAIHEIIHFVWFTVWHDVFGDDAAGYERPNLKWILSEMAVEPVMADERLSSINPYFPREAGGCIYPYFFGMTADGGLVMDRLHQMYRKRAGIRGFMEESYAFCKAHEAEIRAQIEQAEQNGC